MDGTGNFKYSITDLQKTQREAAKRTDKKSRIVEIPARVISKGQAIDINNYNAQHFVTYMSLTNGTLRPARITISMYGVSSAMEAARLAVWHHKKLSNEPIDQDALDACAKIGVTNTAEDVEIPLDEPSAKTGHVQLDEDEAELETRKKSSSKKYADDSGDELPTKKPSKKMIQQPDSDDEDAHRSARNAKVKAKAKAEAAKVSLKKAPVLSDNEDEEHQDTEEEQLDE
jgi:trehalose/maltose hydrolase-like predicted phosphorylase